MKYANRIAITAQIGMEMPVPCPKKYDRINAITNGTGTSFISLMKYLYANAPNNAVKAESKAGTK